MAETVTLWGYRYSVYHRIARVVLAEKGVACDIVDVNPFDEAAPGSRSPHPFGRVPVLSHNGFTIYETGAISRYVDAAFGGPSLTPTLPREAGRMAQVIAIIDNYGYWPMIRQVFAHRVFRPGEGEAPSEAEIAEGLAAAKPVLDALEAIAAEGLALGRGALTLADCHLGPMMDYFIAAEEGARLLGERPALSAWWRGFNRRDSMVKTEPGLQ